MKNDYLFWYDEHDKADEVPYLQEDYEADCSASLSVSRKAFGLLSHLENLSQPAPDWLIPGFIQSRALHVISAAKGTYKTWLGLSTMLSGAYSFPLLGLPASSFSSIYIGADSPLWDLRTQMRKILLGNNVQPRSSASCYIAPLGFRLDAKEHLGALGEFVRLHGIKAIFLDVLLYCHGADENSDREMSLIMKAGKYLRDELGLAVVMLHHHAKTTAKARGADTILQAVEHHYELRRATSEPSVVTIHREKIRGDEDGWDKLRMRLGRTENGGRVLEVADFQPNEKFQGILDALSAGPQSRKNLLAFTGMDGQTLDNSLFILKTENKAKTIERGVWSLVA